MKVLWNDAIVARLVRLVIVPRVAVEQKKSRKERR
jgi:hypothetical protein